MNPESARHVTALGHLRYNTMRLVRPILVMSMLTFGGQSAVAAGTTLDKMPAELEARLAVAAVPPAIRDQASIYLLDPETGYELFRQGTNGIACLVQRTAWELADFRDDIYIPLCYDAAGTSTYLRVILDTAALRASGMGASDLKNEVEKRWRDKTYAVPDRPGLSYMVAPIMRTVGPPDMSVQTMSMPHVMFYAPYVSNSDIGALPDLADHSTLLNPFIDRQGIDEQSYIIQLVGEAERARIQTDERELLSELCAYRDILCLPETHH